MSRVVVVSGGGTGIGRAIAATFAGAGDRVTIVGRRADALERAAKELPGEVTAVPADLTVPADVERLAATVEHVDVVVNNAGGVASDGPVSTLDDHAREWRQELDANVLTAVLLTTALEPKLRQGGRVILMSSIAAVRGGGSYGAAKAALHGWAYALAARGRLRHRPDSAGQRWRRVGSRLTRVSTMPARRSGTWSGIQCVTPGNSTNS